MAGERLDLSSDSAGPKRRTGQERGRPFVGVQFDCCSVYSRVYINRQGTAYVGNCPRCGRRVELKIGPGGSDSRFFTAY